MKKILLIVVCCIYFCGCEKNEKFITICENDNYKIQIYHDRQNISNIELFQSIEFDTILDAIEAEKFYNQNIQSINLSNEIHYKRNNKTIIMNGNLSLKQYAIFETNNVGGDTSTIENLKYEGLIDLFEHIDLICNEKPL